MTGKTTLINAIKQFNRNTPENLDTTSKSENEKITDNNIYTPTNQLTIQKTFCKLIGKNIRLELFDTNMAINTSTILQSNNT